MESKYALPETHRLFSAANEFRMRDSKVIVDVDRKTLLYAFRKGK